MTRTNQIFALFGQPGVRVEPQKDSAFVIASRGVNLYDLLTGKKQRTRSSNVAAWFLDTDYNDLCFYVSQAFFPRTAAWDNLKRALKAQYEDSVWEHFAGTVSEPFTAGENGKIAVKVIDDRGNELLVVKSLAEAEEE